MEETCRLVHEAVQGTNQDFAAQRAAEEQRIVVRLGIGGEHAGGNQRMRVEGGDADRLAAECKTSLMLDVLPSTGDAPAPSGPPPPPPRPPAPPLPTASTVLPTANSGTDA